MGDGMREKEAAFAEDNYGNQASGRPAWQQHLTLDQKLEADRLMNAVFLSQGDGGAALERWWNFRSRYVG